MKVYKEAITLNRNSRGCYILDTVKGCPGGSLHGGRGCYGSCYAKNIADRYGFDFLRTIRREFITEDRQQYLFDFKDERHLNEVIKQIKSARMQFIRIGEMGDPSVDWEHTIRVCSKIFQAGKPIVIITKHWQTIPGHLLFLLGKMNICINTSISALDDEIQIEHRLKQFDRLRGICNSVLRIVSCDFNRDNADGFDRAIVQEELFKINPRIDTVFRPSTKNYFVVQNIIKTKKIKFLRAHVLASVYDKGAFMGMCCDCPDQCGVVFDSSSAST